MGYLYRIVLEERPQNWPSMPAIGREHLLLPWRSEGKPRKWVLFLEALLSVLRKKVKAALEDGHQSTRHQAKPEATRAPISIVQPNGPGHWFASGYRYPNKLLPPAGVVPVGLLNQTTSIRLPRQQTDLPDQSSVRLFRDWCVAPLAHFFLQRDFGAGVGPGPVLKNEKNGC